MPIPVSAFYPPGNFSTEPLGSTTTFTYDSAREERKSVCLLGSQTTYVYGGAGPFRRSDEQTQ
jgi:hypothetical protein